MGLVNQVTLVNRGKCNDSLIDENGIMRIRDCVCVPDVSDLRKLFWRSCMNKDNTSMDLVSDLPRTPSTYEVVWVIMDE